MIHCRRCHHENPPGGRFCGECGARLESLCAACQAANAPTNKFCHQCGEPLTADGQATLPTPETYTPKHLAEKILTSRAALEGERKQVTVLFADLKSSMELLADRDPEEARKLLDPVLEHMMEAVHRYEGTVNQVMGDGIMALFGAPLAHEDHAVRACYAALRMQEAVRLHSDSMRRAEGISVRIRVGLNSGEVVVRAIGSDLRMDYTAVGQTTHLAARMEQLADPGTVLLAPATFALAEDFILVRTLGPTPVRGVSEAVDVYELMGVNPARSRFQAHAARGLTKFVGRTSEIAHLTGALDLARASRGQVVAVVGEPGVGKSRLLWEFVRSDRTDGCLVIEGASVSYGKTTTYLPVIELLRGYFQIEPHDDMGKIREKVTGKLFSLDRALEPALPALLALLDVPVEEDQWLHLDPLQRRQRNLDAVKLLLLRESRAQPLVVVFEDLHWIDGETQAVLDMLVERLPTARMLLLVNYRLEYQHVWGGKTYYRQLRLDALPRASAQQLLEALLGSDDSLTPLKGLLIERSEGNPFFLEESVRTLVEVGALAGARGAYRLRKPLDTVSVPLTVQAILAARIDRLGSDDKQLLQAAAVVGKDVPLALLLAIADLDEDELRQSLTRLQTTEFLYEAQLFPEVEYTFKHALTCEVAYGGLLHDRRRVLHGRIVDAIERLHSDRLAEHVERLAHHATRGELWAKAVTYSRGAGAKAAMRSAYGEATGCFEQAIGALRHLPETPDTIEQSIDIRFDLRTSLLPLGELQRILSCLQEAEALAATLGDQRRLGRLATYLTNHFFLAGDPNRAFEHGRSALEISTTLGDAALLAEANLRLGQVHYVVGEYREAAGIFRRTAESLAHDLRHERFGLPNLFSVGIRNWLVKSLAELGDFAEGAQWGDEGLRIASELERPIDIIVAAQGLGLLYIRQGQAAAATAILERGLALCQQWTIPVWLPEIAAPLGAAYALAGRLAEALPLLEQAVAQDASMRRLGGHSLWVAWLGETYLMAERVEEALTLAERALSLARTHGERGNEGWALRLLAALMELRGQDIAAAADHYGRGLTIAEELGMRPLAAHCHLGLGRVCYLVGDRANAERHRDTARTLFNSLAMPFWLAKAETLP